MRTLRVLAGFCVFSLLYASCGPTATVEDGTEETRDTIEDVNAVTTSGSANQLSTLSQGGLSALARCALPIIDFILFRPCVTFEY